MASEMCKLSPFLSAGQVKGSLSVRPPSKFEVKTLQYEYRDSDADDDGVEGAFLESMLGLVGHKLEFGRPRGHRQGVSKGLGWFRSGWGPGSGSNMGPT